MKTNPKTCDLELLDRYSDHELGADEYTLLDKHLEDCPFCQKILRDNQSISALFGAGIDEELSETHLQAVEERVFAVFDRKRAPWWSKLGCAFASKRFYVPATAVLAGVVLLSFFMQPTASVSGPSAIISSLRADVGSVMILETPKSHHTVIWFNEPASESDKNGGVQQDDSASLTFPGKGFLAA